MRTQQILLVGLPRLVLTTLTWSMLSTPYQAVAQSSCGGTVQSITYDTAFSSTGSNTYSLTFPKFATTGGYTLISAVLVANATTNATVNFLNTNTSSQDFWPELDRTEVIKSGSTMIYHANNSPSSGYLDGWSDEVYLDPSGGANDHITKGPEDVYNNDQVVYDSIVNGVLTTFKGAGNINLSYQANITLNYVPVGVLQTPAPVFTDNIGFSLTYYFCNPTVLANNILTFTAYREDQATVALRWMTTNEQGGRKYVVELSRGGADFEAVSSLPSDPVDQDAIYSYPYAIGPADNGVLYFRIKMIDTDGRASYSEVRMINVNNGSGTGEGSGSALLIYPNPPTDHINIQFPSASTDWQVDIMAADGSLIQRNVFHGVSTGQVNFVRALAAGTYFVRATDLQSAQSKTGSFVMRHS